MPVGVLLAFHLHQWEVALKPPAPDGLRAITPMSNSNIRYDVYFAGVRRVAAALFDFGVFMHMAEKPKPYMVSKQATRKIGL